MIPKQLYHRKSRPRIGDDVPIATSNLLPCKCQHLPKNTGTRGRITVTGDGVQESGCDPGDSLMALPIPSFYEGNVNSQQAVSGLIRSS